MKPDPNAPRVPGERPAAPAMTHARIIRVPTKDGVRGVGRVVSNIASGSRVAGHKLRGA